MPVKQVKISEDGPLRPSVQKLSNHPARIPGGMSGGNRKNSYFQTKTIENHEPLIRATITEVVI